MARDEDNFYGDSFEGFPPPRPETARGMDPNFRREGYRGDRMYPGERYQAAYGRYRMHHRGDLAGYGRRDEEIRARGRYDREFRGYDREFGRDREGGVRHDEAYLHDFNANSVAFRGTGRRSVPPPPRSFGRPEEVNRGGRDPRTDTSRNLRYDQGFGRYVGYNTGGFSEPWVGYDPIGRKDRSL